MSTYDCTCERFSTISFWRVSDRYCPVHGERGTNPDDQYRPTPTDPKETEHHG